MMLQFTLALEEKPIHIRSSAILAVFYGCIGAVEGTYIQVGMQNHFVKESVEEVMLYLKD